MKGKGKIHPSPAPSTSTDAGEDQGVESLAVFALLPLAILALTAALSDEDKEVLAYLLTQSIEGSPDGKWNNREPGKGQHRPTYGCGCFDCYTTYWSRWDRSPQHKLIHQVIEAFEEHLASSEKKGDTSSKKKSGAKSRVRRKKHKSAEKGREKAEKESSKDAESEMKEEAENFVKEEVPAGAADSEAEATTTTGGRRRSWADAIGIYNWRLWGFWGSGNQKLAGEKEE
ncbi:uncharacterized protein LOC121985451 [Zingiber officinale]|uniref:Uncharacterized protein n=1 Tax=Zingiber officinale TaxID=94328 RepID=A0A8J5GFA8_ZINOF|nr:uncharacterized protein LOC121985451 [Zingiber officinale]KAG6504680.1 hypothetical protein ZIOFF_037016 [Zingiber officinale]